MQCLPPIGHCLNCLDLLSPIEHKNSVSNTGHALCSSCGTSLKKLLRVASRATVKLYFSLKQKQLSVELRLDTHGEVDIYLLSAGMKIEVDAPRNHSNPLRSLNQLQWTLQAWPKLSQAILHIPNDLVAYNLEETTACLVTHNNQQHASLHRFGVCA